MTESEIVAKVAVDLITELFKKSLLGLREAEEWITERNRKYDPLGLAAKKYAERLEERYNYVRIFGMNEPVPLRNLYTRVNILKKITASHRSTVEELQKSFTKTQSWSFGNTTSTEDGIDVVNKLGKFIVLGKPGAGKTTFLKYIVLQALDGKLRTKRIPVFISLRDWSESEQTLVDFIIEQFDICGFPPLPKSHPRKWVDSSSSTYGEGQVRKRLESFA